MIMVLSGMLLSGCSRVDHTDSGSGAGLTTPSPVVKPTESVTPVVNTGDASRDVRTEVPYAYEQELNILQDNNRNYYEIFVYSFYDSNKDGIGDINGVIEKLDYIQGMGFNGIWLMPVMPAASYHKYDVTDYYNIDPEYGSLEDFKRLAEECHKRDIKLIIDFVINHTSSKHPWFTEAVTYLESLKDGEAPDASVCPYVGYYHFTKESNGNTAYHRVGTTDFYYEGVFWEQMPDLALENKAVRKEIEKIVKFWIALGVDGLRLDAAKEYFTGETQKNVEVLKWFESYVTGIKPDAYIVGEVWEERNTIANYYKSGVSSFFNFPLAQYNGIIINTVRKLGTGSATSFADSITKMQKLYGENNPDYIDAPFVSNHDTTRISAMCVNNEEQMKMAAGLVLSLSGSPFVYYGEEIGMNSLGDKDENKRLPMRWSAVQQTGMTRGPVKADKIVQKFEPVDVQEKDPLSILNYYKRALRIRNENPEIARGTVKIVEALTNQNICVLEKDYQGSRLLLVYNITQTTEAVNLMEAGYDKLSLRGYLTVDGSVVEWNEGILSLPAYSIAILK